MLIEKAWNILKMDPTTDESAIKTQYRTLLPQHNPEDDPDGFRELREAYETACAYIQNGGASAEDQSSDQPKDEIDLWVDQIAELYKHMELRSNPDVWKEKLEDPLCVGLDTTYEVRKRLLIFLMSHHYLPHNVWVLLDRVFRITAEKKDLIEIFPEDYINYIIQMVKQDHFGSYDYFTYTGDDRSKADYDEYLNRFSVANKTLRNIRDEIEYYRLPTEQTSGDIAIKSRAQVLAEKPDLKKQLEDLSADLDALSELNIYHAYEDLERISIAKLTGNTHILKHGNAIPLEEFATNMIEKYKDANVLRRCGEAFALSGKWDVAFPLWENALEQSPDNALIYYDLSKYHFQKGDLEEADSTLRKVPLTFCSSIMFRTYYLELQQAMITHYRTMIAENPSDDEIYIKYCWSLFDIEHYNDVLTALQKRDFSSNPDSYYDYVILQGRCYLMLDHYEEAYSWLKKWLDNLDALKDDGSEKYQRRQKSYGFIYFALGTCQYNKAILDNNNDTLLSEAESFTLCAVKQEKESDASLTYLYLLGNCYLRHGKYQDSLDLARNMLEKDPGFTPALLIHQEANYFLQDGQSVVNDYTKILEAYPEYPRNYTLTIRVFLEHDQTEDAKHVLKDADENNIDDLALRFEELRYLRASESQDSAENVSIKADELISRMEATTPAPSKPKDEQFTVDDVWYQVACAYGESQLYDKALLIIEERAKHGVNERRFIMLHANILRLAGRFEQALEYYQQLDPNHSDDYVLHYRMGICYKELKYWKRAEESFLKSVELYPEDDYAVYELADLYKRRYEKYHALSDHKNALEYFDRLVALNPSSFVYSKRARMHCYRANMDACIADLSEASKADNDKNADIFYRLGDMYYINRQPDKAEEQFRKAIELNGSKQYPSIWQMGDLLGSRGDWKGAVDFLLQYNSEYLKDFDYQRKLVDFMIGAGMADEAANVYTRAVKDKIIEMPEFYWGLLYISAACTPEKFQEDLKGYQKPLCELLKIHDPIHSLYRFLPADSSDKSQSENMMDYCHKIGDYLLYSRNLKLAQKYLECAAAHAKALVRNSHGILRSLALVYFLQGNQKKAEECAQQGIDNRVIDTMRSAEVANTDDCDMNTEEYHLHSMECDNAYNYSSLALFYLCKGDKNRCREYLDQIKHCMLCLRCRTQECFDELIVRGYLAEAEGDNTSAVAFFERGAKICPRDTECTLTAYYFKQKAEAEALKTQKGTKK